MRAPKDIYERFVEFEEQAAAVYLRMASRFTPENLELSSLWLDMGMQEKQHAGLLQFCMEEELFATQLPGEKEIHEAEALFSGVMKRASDPDLSVGEAFQIALELEASEINAIYDRLTQPMHASMYLLRRKIAASLPDHLGYLLQEARRFDLPEELLKKLGQLAMSHPSNEKSSTSGKDDPFTGHLNDKSGKSG
jgi:hypothetical protein